MFSADPFSMDAFASSTDDEVDSSKSPEGLLSPTIAYHGIDYTIDSPESSDFDQSITHDYREFRESVDRLEEMKKWNL